MNIYHFSYCPYFMGNSMVMLSFQECNFHCKGCLRKKDKGDIYAEESRFLKDWNLSTIFKEVSLLKPDRIWFAGFEPTLDPELISIIKKFSQLDVYIALATNGSLIDEKYAWELKKAGVNLIF